MVQRTWQPDGGSFRDPAGQVEWCRGKIRRRINDTASYRQLMDGGLYQELADRGLIIPHTELDDTTIGPEVVSLISYPYEWSFRSLQSAAAATLDIAITAMEYGMMLKDASAFNIQYHNGKWRLIDTLSFLPYEDGKPWPAYLQFLRHFYYPLLLRMYHIPYPYWQNIDGVPPTDAVKLLPRRNILNLLRAAQIYPLARGSGGTKAKIPMKRMVSFLTYLRSSISKWRCRPQRGWRDYHSCSYTGVAREQKMRRVEEMLGSTQVNQAVDLGANTGEYTRLARSTGLDVVAIDSDHDCTDAIEPLSLWADLCNPPPAIGWDNRERLPLLDRVGKWNQDGLVIALALVHHLCIANNVPVGMVLDVFSRIGEWLLIEFVSPNDPMAMEIAQGRIFPEYNKDVFEKELETRYEVCYRQPITESERVLYLARRR